jgi:hypothetical protein
MDNLIYSWLLEMLTEDSTATPDLTTTHQALLKRWGKDYPGEGCIFITPEGIYLNLYPLLMNHDRLCDWVDQNGYGPTTGKASWFINTLNYIRCRNTASICYIDLHTEVKPAQIRALQTWLETKVKAASLDIGTPTNEYKSYNLQEYFPEDIIKIIKRYYSSGKLYEDKTAKTKLF